MTTRDDARASAMMTAMIGEGRNVSVTREGTVAGLLAAAGVALWYLFRDVMAGHPFFTPRLLGQGLGGLLGVETLSQGSAAAIIGYTVFHLAAFVIVGLVASAVVRLAWRHATVLAGALIAFVMAQAIFWVGIGLINQGTLAGMLGWSQLAAGNIIGCAIVGFSLWRAHPELPEELRVAMSGTGNWEVSR